MSENRSGRFSAAFALLLLVAILPVHADPLDRRAGIVLRPDDGSVIKLVEVGGAEVVVRFVALDAAGAAADSGRVFVVGPLEERTVRLRDALPPEMLSGADLRVEVLQGTGRVTVTATDRNGRVLEPQADALLSRRRAVSPPARVPPSEVLIDRAEASGELDSETALLYRVFALFGDARLPERYHGDDSAVVDSLYMVEVRGRFETLSPATQALVQPFRIPPAYEGSWANPANGLAGTPATAAADPPPCKGLNVRWRPLDTLNGQVRVWYRLGSVVDFAKAIEIANVIDDRIWPKLSGLMVGHLPMSDEGVGCFDGGDGRLDIYIVDVPINHFQDHRRCSPTPGFIEVKPTARPGVVAHEIFHAMQASFPLKGFCTNATDEDYKWWTESSAEWAVDFVFGKDDQSEHASISNFLSTPETRLDYVNKAREYGAYLLPFYVYKNTSSATFVRVAWENCATEPALEAVDKAIGKYENVWPLFIRQNWNRPPIQEYVSWDDIREQAHETAREVSLAGSEGSIPIDYDLPRLSATYHHFVFKDDSTSSVSFWNGATFKLSLRDSGVLGILYGVEAADEDTIKGVRVWALIKIEGQAWREEDWTKRASATFCRDTVAERITDLVIIISNSQFEERERRAKPPGLAPFLRVSNMGCWKWKGTATKTDSLSGIVMQTSVTWTPTSQQGPPSISYAAKGTILWSVSGTCSGSGTLPVIAPLSSLTSYNYIPPQGNHNRTYTVTGADDHVVELMCPNNATLPTPLGPWLITPPTPIPGISLPGAKFLHVSDDGRVMEDVYVVNSFQQWRWKFMAERE